MNDGSSTSIFKIHYSTCDQFSMNWFIEIQGSTDARTWTEAGTWTDARLKNYFRFSLIKHLFKKIFLLDTFSHWRLWVIENLIADWRGHNHLPNWFSLIGSEQWLKIFNVKKCLIENRLRNRNSQTVIFLSGPCIPAFPFKICTCSAVCGSLF